MNQDKNYYLNSTINNSGIAETQNPANINDTSEYRYINKPINLGKASPLNLNVGTYFTKDSKHDQYLGDVNQAIEQGLTIEDLRADRQSGWDMLGNALINNAVIAGTTMISSSIGFIDGIFSALASRDVSKLWDNSTNQWAANAQDWARENFSIYRGQDYEDKSLLSKMGTGIFWADFIQNLGYAEGMMLPGKAVGALLQNAPKVLQKTLPSLVASMGEASIEAVNKKNDSIEQKIAELNQNYSSLMATAETPFAQGQLNLAYEEELQNIENDARNAGNFVYGSNIAFLTMTNALEWGNTLSRGFRTGNKIKGGIKRKGDLYGINSLAWEMTKATAKNVGRSAMEGFEEFGQMVIEKTPDYYTDYNSFNKSKFNKDKRELTSNMWQSLMMGYSETMNDPEMATAVAQGFLTGMLGIPSVRMSKMPVNLEGNIGTELYDTYKQYKNNQRIVEAINTRLQDDANIKSYYDGIVRHMSIQDDMNKFLEEGDEFNYKNAESAQFINDIIMFDNIGDLGRLEEILASSTLIDYETYKKTGEAISTATNEEISELIQNTTNAEGFGPFVRTSVSKNAKGENVTTTQPMEVNEVKEILNKRFTDLISMVENYKSIKESLETVFPNLNNETLGNAIFLQNQSKALQQRFDDVLDKVYNRVKRLFDSSKNIPSAIVDNGGKRSEEYVYTTDEDGNPIKYAREEVEIVSYEDDGTPVYAPKKGSHTYSNISKNTFLNLLFGETSKDFISSIQEQLNSPQSTLNPAEKLEIISGLLDIKKLSEASNKLKNSLESILTNPNKSKEDNTKLEEEIVTEGQQKEAEQIAKVLSEAKTMAEFKEAFNSIENIEARKNALDSEISKGNKIAKDFEKLYNYFYQASTLIDNSDYNDEDKKDLKNVLKYVIDNADSIEDFLNPDTDFSRTLISQLREYKDEDGNKVFDFKDNIKPISLIQSLRGIFNNIQQKINTIPSAQSLPTTPSEASKVTGQSEVPVAEKGINLEDIKGKSPEEILSGDSTDSEETNAVSTFQNPLPNDANDEFESTVEGEKARESTDYIVTASEYEFGKEFENGYIEFPNKLNKERYRKLWDYLKSKNAFSFVDEGGLVSRNVERIDPKNPSSPAKVYFILDDQAKNDTGYDVLLMAVKVDGKYQIIGVVPSKSSLYDYVVINKRDGIEYVKEGNESTLHIVHKDKVPLTTKVTNIFNGIAPYTEEGRDLNDVQNVDEALKNPVLGISTLNGLELNMSNVAIKTPQERRLGRLYLFIRNAQGILSPIVLRTKTFNEIKDGTIIRNKISNIIKKHVEIFYNKGVQVDKSTAISYASEFAKELNKYLYLPKNVKIFFDGLKIHIYEVELNENNEFVKTPDGKYVKKEGKDIIIPIAIREKVENDIGGGITEATYQTKFETVEDIQTKLLEALEVFDFRIQVNEDIIKNRKAFDDLYNSNAFTTNVSLMKIIGSFFSIPSFDGNTGIFKGENTTDIPTITSETDVSTQSVNTKYSNEENYTVIEDTPYAFYTKDGNVFIVNITDSSKDSKQFGNNDDNTLENYLATILIPAMQLVNSNIEDVKAKPIKNTTPTKYRYELQDVLKAFKNGLKLYLDTVLSTSEKPEGMSENTYNLIKSLYFTPKTVETTGDTPESNINALIGDGNSNPSDLFRQQDSKDRNLMDKEQELAWISKVLPQLSKEDRIKFVEGLIDVANKGTKAWGMFDGSIITLSNIAAEGTLYHEAFHAVFHLLLNENRRQALLKEATKEYGNKDDISLEEDLAEAFREFIMMGGKDTRSLGQKILDFFKNLAIKIFNWNKFSPSKYYYFKNINDGKYANMVLPVVNTTNNDIKYKEITIQEAENFVDYISTRINNSNIIWAHPAQGKTFMAKQNNKTILDFDTEIKPIINERMGYPKEYTPKELQLRAKSEGRLDEYREYLNQELDKALLENKDTGRKIMISDMYFLKNRANIIDTVITMSKEQFYKNSKQRGEEEDYIIDWKEGIDTIMQSIPKSKIINTDEYLNSIFSQLQTQDYNAEKFKEDVQLFLNNFGITIEEVNNYEGELPLFNALDRVINAKSAEDISDGVGEAIAFMMQHDSAMHDLLAMGQINAQGAKAIKRKTNEALYKGHNKKLRQLTSEDIKIVGKEISKELRKLYNLEPIEFKEDSLASRIWKLLSTFFNHITDAIFRTRMVAAANFAKSAANAVMTNNTEFIVNNFTKPGTTTEGDLVDVAQALRENPYEEHIISVLQHYNISLGGGASIAATGNLYRPSENPLHDLDMSAVGHTEESVENILAKEFKYYEKTNEIIGDNENPLADKKTVTYLIMDRPFRQEKSLVDNLFNIIDEKTGLIIGTRVNSELVLSPGVKGKMLDFFIGSENSPYPDVTINFNGKDYLISNYKNAMEFKVTVAREKDIWDYNRFTINKPIKEVSITPLQQLKQAITPNKSVFESLPTETQTELKQNNWTAEEFNSLNKEEQEVVLNCLGAY